MKEPNPEIGTLFDGLTHSTCAFALYRLPWQEECRLVLQTSGEAEQPEGIACLNGKRGFVMAPFRQEATHPLVLIRLDVEAQGWEEIAASLTKLTDLTGHVDRQQQPTQSTSPRSASSKLPEGHTADDEVFETYAAAFARFIAPLRTGRFQKLVLSRSARTKLPAGFSPVRAFVEACNSYPRMMVYLCHTPASGTWMGSTPEILLSGAGSEWHTVALAGTMTLQGEGEKLSVTAWRLKDREEQAYVSRYIRQIITRLGSDVVEEGPYTARAGQLVHLKTDFRFRLAKTDTLGCLLQALHPTPAVCGLPKEEAFRFITEHEGYDRRFYSGFIGLLDPCGQTDLYVNLRCMEVEGEEAVLYAGGGLLACSDVKAEWEETKEKMKTMERLTMDN